MLFLVAAIIGLFFSADLTAGEFDRDEYFGSYRIHDAQGKVIAKESGRCGPSGYFELEPKAKFIFSGDVAVAFSKAGLLPTPAQTYLGIVKLQFKDSAEASKVEVLLNGRRMDVAEKNDRSDFGERCVATEVVYTLAMEEGRSFRVQVTALRQVKLKILEYDMKPQ